MEKLKGVSERREELWRVKKATSSSSNIYMHAMNCGGDSQNHRASLVVNILLCGMVVFVFYVVIIMRQEPHFRSALFENLKKRESERNLDIFL